ncbi:MAG: putative Ig domain-containing protein [Planctomyces sp.]|nr:putative Ig domain-containing protein [Planctomyces sp.]
MDDKKRTKLLAGLLIGVVGLYWGRSIVDGFLFEPVRKAEQKLASAEKDFELQTDKSLALRAARNRLEEWRSMSLPEDTLVAQRLYREWIEDLAQQCAFSGLSVEPGTKSEQPGRFLEVAVDVKGETNLSGLTQFLFLFEKTGLVHRVSDLKVKSTGSQGDPRLEVSMTCQGMSVAGSGLRNEIFVRSELTSEINPTGTEISVVSAEGFPATAPFTVRLDRELVKVTAVDGNRWTLERGADGSKADTHTAGTTIELRPELYERKDSGLGEYAGLLAKSPFAAPVPPKKYSPRVAGLSKQTIQPGDEVKVTAKADDFNADLGEACFSLVNPPAGMTIDEKTGEILWKTEASLAAGDYKAGVVVTQTENPELRLEASLDVTVKLPNAAPVPKGASEAVVVLGQPFLMKMEATDDGPVENLTWSLGPGMPEGLKIDSKTGQLSWTPAVSFKPGEYVTEVKVTDSGAEAKSGSAKIKFQVRDDSASMTLLTGAVSKDGTRYAWFRNKGTGENQQLKLGERLKVDEIDAEIVRIENRFVELSDVGGLWKLELGANLRQRRNLQPPAEATPVSKPADPEPEVTPAEDHVPADPSKPAEISQPAADQDSTEGGSGAAG